MNNATVEKNKNRLETYKKVNQTVLDGIKKCKNRYEAEEIIFGVIEDNSVDNDTISSIMMNVFEFGKIEGQKELKKKIANL